MGFRHRRLGRHGLPHREHALHGPGPARSDRRPGRDLRATTRTAIRSGRSSPSSSRRTTGGRPWSSGGTTAASGPRGTYSTPNCSRARKASGRPWPAAAAWSSARRASSTPPDDYAEKGLSLAKGLTEPEGRVSRVARPLRGMGPGDQGRRAGHVELPRLRRPADRDDPPGQPGRLGGRRGRARARRSSGTPRTSRPPTPPRSRRVIQTEYRKGYSL